MTEEEDSQSELLIAEEKMSPEQEGQLMPRYSAFLSWCSHMTDLSVLTQS